MFDTSSNNWRIKKYNMYINAFSGPILTEVPDLLYTYVSVYWQIIFYKTFLKTVLCKTNMIRVHVLPLQS